MQPNSLLVAAGNFSSRTAYAKRGAGKTRKGMDGLAMLAQKVLEQDPLSGHLFVFRGRAANLIMFGTATDCACSPSGSNAISSCTCGACMVREALGGH